MLFTLYEAVFVFLSLMDSPEADYLCLQDFLEQQSARDLSTQQEDCYFVRFPKQPKYKRQYVICIFEGEFVKVSYEKTYENKMLQLSYHSKGNLIYFLPPLPTPRRENMISKADLFLT